MNRRQFLTQAAQTTAAVALSRYVVAQSGQALANVDAVLANGGTTSLAKSALKDLSDALHGRLLLPQDQGYDEARRLASARFDKHPGLIVQATGAADVRCAINFAREHGLLLAIKSGGHSDFGISSCDGGMMIDLSPMRAVRVDAAAKRAWVAAGSLAGLIDHETVSQGLAVPLGGSATVGIGGLATGGGFGRLSRQFGLTLDSIRSVEIATAQGKLLRASEAENPDLFWGVRGGGGNFGVVTGFEFELHPIPDRVIAGTIAFPFSDIVRVLSAYGDYGPTAPDELSLECFIGIRSSPDESFVQLDVCYSGKTENADGILRTIRQFGRVTKEDVSAVGYLTVQGSDVHANARLADTRPSREAYFRAGLLAGMQEGLIRTITAHAQPHPIRRQNILFLHGGGAISRVANEATAFPHRSSTHDMITVINWPVGDTSEDHAKHAEEVWLQMQEYTDGFYNNDMAGGVTDDAVARNFGQNYPRLARLKAKYDPGNLLRLNANIRPS